MERNGTERIGICMMGRIWEKGKYFTYPGSFGTSAGDPVATKSCWFWCSIIISFIFQTLELLEFKLNNRKYLIHYNHFMLMLLPRRLRTRTQQTEFTYSLTICLLQFSSLNKQK